MQIRVRMAMLFGVILLLGSMAFGDIEPIKRIKVAKGPYFLALSADGENLFLTGLRKVLKD